MISHTVPNTVIPMADDGTPGTVSGIEFTYRGETLTFTSNEVWKLLLLWKQITGQEPVESVVSGSKPEPPLLKGAS